METPLALAQAGSHWWGLWGRVIMMPPDGKRCETEPAGFPLWQRAFWWLWGHGQHGGVSWALPDSHPPFLPLLSLTQDLREFKVAWLLLGLEPLVKLHHAFFHSPFQVSGYIRTGWKAVSLWASPRDDCCGRAKTLRKSFESAPVHR